MIAAVLAVLAVLAFAHLGPQRALDAAVANSPDVAAANARVAQSAASLAAARSVLAPSLTSSYQQVPQGNPPGPNIISRLVTVGLQTSVNEFLAYGESVRQNVLTLVASRADADVATRSERVKTLGLYYDALKARAVVVARERALTLATATRDAAQKRFDAGDVPKLDVLRAEVALARASADLETATAGNANATEALRIETGLAAGDDLAATTEATLAEPAPAPLDATQATRFALAVRAEVASAVATQNAAEAARTVARRGAFPALGITGGYTSGTDSGVAIGAPSVNVQFALPLGAGARARVAVEDGKVAEARAKADSARRGVVLEVGAAARTAAALQRTAAAAARARALAEAELAATELGYRSGASSSFDILNARETYTQTVVEELSAAYEAIKARASLELEIGR